MGVRVKKSKSLAGYRLFIFGLMNTTLVAGWTVDTFRDDFYPEVTQVQAQELATAPLAPLTNEVAGQTASVVASSSAGQVVTENQMVKPEQAVTTSSVEAYIREVFGADAEIALAVGKAESRLIPEKTLIARKGHYSWSSPTYKGECSIGLFMINLAEDGCQGKKVHYDKVPGDTLEAKIEWLKDPKNNIDFAKKIYEGRGNSFMAWSAYSHGGYEKFLESN